MSQALNHFQEFKPAQVAQSPQLQAQPIQAQLQPQQMTQQVCYPAATTTATLQQLQRLQTMPIANAESQIQQAVQVQQPMQQNAIPMITGTYQVCGEDGQVYTYTTLVQSTPVSRQLSDVMPATTPIVGVPSLTQPLPAWQAVDPTQVQQLQLQQKPVQAMPVSLAHTATLKKMKSQTRTINRVRSYHRTKKEQMLQQMLNMCKEATNAPICRHWKAGGKCSFGMMQVPTHRRNEGHRAHRS